MGAIAPRREPLARRESAPRSSERLPTAGLLPTAEELQAREEACWIDTIVGAQKWFNAAHHDAVVMVELAHRPRDYERYAIEYMEPVFFHNLVVRFGRSEGIQRLRRLSPNPGVGPHYGLYAYNWHELVIDLVARITSFICWAVADVDNVDPAYGSMFSPSLDTPYQFRTLLTGSPMPKEIKTVPKRYIDATRKALCEIPYDQSDFACVRNKLWAAFEDVSKTTAQDGPWSHEDSPKQWAKRFDMSESTFRRRRASGVIRCKVITERRIKVHVDDLPTCSS